MSRRTRADNQAAAETAAAQASEAARTLAARSHEARKVEPDPEPQEPTLAPDRIDKLRNSRPHEQALDDLIARRNSDQPEEEEVKVEPKAELKVEPKVEAAPPVKEAAPTEAPKTIRAKVDGEEFDVPAEEVEAAGGLVAFQKEKAAEKRLKETREALAESKRMNAQIAQWLQKQAQTPAVPPAPKKSDTDFIAEKMDTIRFGTPQEAAAALLEIQNRARQPVPDHNQLVAHVTSVMDNKRAVEQFVKDFPEIVANPHLIKLAKVMEAEEFNKARSEQRAVDWSKAYSTIGNTIKSLVSAGSTSQPTSSQTPSNTSQGSEKEARKASITNLPTASARAELPKEEKELTPEEERKQFIADARKTRRLG